MYIHTIKQGDSLWELANTYKVSLDAIYDANGLTGQSMLVIGEAIIIPTPSTSGSYTVKYGDTLWSIGQKLGLSIQELSKANHIRNPAMIYPGLVLQVPIAVKPIIEVNAYSEKMNAAGVELVNTIGDKLTYLSPFSYRVQMDGSMQPLNDTDVIAAAYQNRIAPMMVITNFENGNFSPEIAHSIVSNPETQDRLIRNIVAVFQEKGYMSLNIDFEYVPPADKNLYETFLTKVVQEMHKYGYLVSTALAPKLSADQVGTLYEAHDYQAQGAIVDFVILMTYEWGWSGGPPRAVAPLNEVVKVLNHAVSVIPPEKIVMGMPLYGYDWTLPYVQGGKWAPTVSPYEAVVRAAKYGATIMYDEQSQAPYYNYYDEEGKQHIVWFDDARSVQAKFDIVKAYKLRGVSYWVLGVPFPQNWYVLTENFNVKKLV